MRHHQARLSLLVNRRLVWRTPCYTHMMHPNHLRHWYLGKSHFASLSEFASGMVSCVPALTPAGLHTHAHSHAATACPTWQACSINKHRAAVECAHNSQASAMTASAHKHAIAADLGACITHVFTTSGVPISKPWKTFARWRTVNCRAQEQSDMCCKLAAAYRCKHTMGLGEAGCCYMNSQAMHRSTWDQLEAATKAQ